MPRLSPKPHISDLTKTDILFMLFIPVLKKPTQSIQSNPSYLSQTIQFNLFSSILVALLSRLWL
ncbi:hypothetical protein J8L86_06865 [Shewanella sp. MMG014]|nr:hypothetical protein [Shewanella sp. MMG014]